MEYALSSFPSGFWDSDCGSPFMEEFPNKVNTLGSCNAYSLLGWSAFLASL